MDPKVDKVLEKAKTWKAEFKKLRAILHGFPLEEELKWGKPCYSLEGKNVVLIGGFKQYCVLLFFKGTVMADPKGILVAPGRIQAARQIRFTGLEDIVARESIVKAYIAEAIKVEKAGVKVKMKAHSEYKIPEELERELNRKPSLKAAFEALTPGRQRGYMFHISDPKLAKTREARVEKCIPRILAGKGLDD
jgi:uncharacterized protein YdeI (YjbR/CyaY-like superfamily)